MYKTYLTLDLRKDFKLVPEILLNRELTGMFEVLPEQFDSQSCLLRKLFAFPSDPLYVKVKHC